MQTSLKGISTKAAQNKTYRFQNLYSLLTTVNLIWCWQFINKKSASGVDQMSALEYEQNLANNTESLSQSVKRGWYRAKLVLRKYIPKLNGKMRPLGIPAISDKLLQIAVKKILETIYEEDFHPFSYGYRPRTGAHKAIKDLSSELRYGHYNFVVEADIKGFFDNLDHNKLLNMLMKRIDDKSLLKLIRRWLKAGILDIDGMVIHPTTGCPQGGIVSPILANVYLHYALDNWFEEIVKTQCKRKAYICRYADDFVCAFVLKSDAENFYNSLSERLAKFGLEVAPEKTNILLFNSTSKRRFEFLGFEFYWGKGRQEKPIFKRRTSRKKLRAAIANFKVWSQKHGCLKKHVLFTKLNRKLRGYWNYYGIRGNYDSMGYYFYTIKGILFKWLNRRSQRKSYNWTGFIELLKDFYIAKPRICHDF